MNPPTERRRRVRRAALWALKLAVTVSLIAWMFSRISLRELSANLRASLGPWLLAAALVAAANVTLGGVRWRILLNATGTPIPLGEAVRLVWAGLFFNTFLPTGLVGDALRGAWTTRLTERARAYWSVLLDRVAALAGLMLLAAIGLALPQGRALPSAPALAGACLVLGLSAFVLLAAPDRVFRAVVQVGGAWARRALTGKVMDAPPAVARGRALLVASLLHLMVVLDVALLTRAAKLQVPWAVLMAVVPAMLVASYVPVSISGIGVREAALVELLGQVGVPPAAAMTVSLLILGISIALSLAGGVVYLISTRAGAFPGSGPAAGPVADEVVR